MTKNEALEETAHTLMNNIAQKIDDAVLESLPAMSIKTGEINLRGDKIMMHGDIEKEVVVPVVFDKWKQTLIDDVVSTLGSRGYNTEIIEKTMKVGVIELITRGGNGIFEYAEEVEDFYFDFNEDEEDELIDWVDNNKLEAIKAVLFGYKVKEQLYYVIFPGFNFNDKYLNYSERNGYLLLCDKTELKYVKTKFTMDFIEEHFPEYKQFAVKIEEVDD